MEAENPPRSDAGAAELASAPESGTAAAPSGPVVPTAPSAGPTLPAPIPARMDSLIALLLSWLAPGAGQLYLGRTRRGIAFFAVVIVLFELSAQLGSGLAVELARFHWFSSSNAIVAALAVIPETLALGPTLLLSGRIGDLRPYPPVDPTLGFAAHLGLVCSALGGIVGAFSMADAHHLARVAKHVRPGEKSSVLAALLSWILPGAGQFWLGQRGKGVLAGSAVIALFALGVAFSGGTCVQRGEYYFYWAGQMLLGLPAALASLAFWDAGLQEFWPKADLGLLLATSAGLLNVLLILNAYTVGERLARREPTRDEIRAHLRANAAGGGPR
jgi:TM2 domain-containing membrane protein YozV